MTKLITTLLILLALIPGALAAQSTSDRATNPIYNLLPNPGYENRSAGWTASGGATATANVTASDGMGSLGYEWDSNSASQTLVSNAVPIPVGLQGGNCAAFISIRVPSGTATHTFTVDDGTNNIVNPVTIISSSRYVRQPALIFPCPSSGSLRLKLTSVNANEPSIYLDAAYLGRAEGAVLGSVSQATLYGTMKQAGAASCNFVQSTSSGINNWVDLGTAGSCASSWTATGGVTAPAATSHVATLNNMPPGDYYIVVTGVYYSASLGDSLFRISDGTSTDGVTIISGSNQVVSHVVGKLSYTTPGSRTFRLQSADSHAGSAGVFNEIAGREFSWSFYRFPTASEQAVRIETINWKVDATIAGANPALSSSSVSSYTGVENGSLTLTNNSGQGNVAAQIPCSSTNAPTGTTCSVGNESVGVSFNLPAAGDVRACALFTHNLVNSGSSNATTYFQIVETANNAQTILQEGRGKVGSGNDSFSRQQVTPYHVCGNFSFTSAGQKTLRLMYEQLVVNTPTQNIIVADAAANEGQRDIHWTVTPLNQAQPAPILIGSVTSNSSGAERVERIRFGGSTDRTNCTSTPCTIYNQSGSWVTSVTRVNTGRYTLNFSSGTFSVAPSCTISSANIGNKPLACDADLGTTSSININCLNNTSSAYDLDAAANVICMGPR
jgi:hypothetical protein